MTPLKDRRDGAKSLRNNLVNRFYLHVALFQKFKGGMGWFFSLAIVVLDSPMARSKFGFSIHAVHWPMALFFSFGVWNAFLHRYTMPKALRALPFSSKSLAKSILVHELILSALTPSIAFALALFAVSLYTKTSATLPLLECGVTWLLALGLASAMLLSYEVIPRIRFLGKTKRRTLYARLFCGLSALLALPALDFLKEESPLASRPLLAAVTACASLVMAIVCFNQWSDRTDFERNPPKSREKKDEPNDKPQWDSPELGRLPRFMPWLKAFLYAVAFVGVVFGCLWNLFSGAEAIPSSLTLLVITLPVIGAAAMFSGLAPLYFLHTFRTLPISTARLRWMLLAGPVAMGLVFGGAFGVFILYKESFPMMLGIAGYYTLLWIGAATMALAPVLRFGLEKVLTVIFAAIALGVYYHFFNMFSSMLSLEEQADTSLLVTLFQAQGMILVPILIGAPLSVLYIPRVLWRSETYRMFNFNDSIKKYQR
jgi:MFS family permease